MINMDDNEEKRVKKEVKELIKTEERQRKEEENAPKIARKRKLKKYYRLKNSPPVRSTLEEIGNSVSHGVGAIFAVVALVLLLLNSDTTLEYLASWVYGVSMFITMTTSCLYHAWKTGSTVKRIWRRFDYSSIYFLIGGTFAPIYLVYMSNTLGITLFIIQWSLIVIGITFVCIFGPGRIKWLHYTLYFAIGWSGIMFIPIFIINESFGLLWMILGGGIVYTLGMIPFAKKKVKGAHFIWHIFVLAGTIVHFIGILLFIY